MQSTFELGKPYGKACVFFFLFVFLQLDNHTQFCSEIILLQQTKTQHSRKLIG